MSLLDDLTGWKQKAIIAAGVVAIVAFLVLVRLFFHYKDEAAKVPGLIEANLTLAAQTERDDKIITQLNTDLASLRKKFTNLQGDLDANIKRNPGAYACVVPVDGVRLLNLAIETGAR